MFVEPNSVVTGNTLSQNAVGLFVDCPTNVVGNTVAANATISVTVIGEGCGLTNNLITP